MDNYAALFGKSLGAGSGGSGTNNYNELTNKPSINGTVLSGNKTAANLGLQPEIKESSKLSSDLVDDSSSSQKFVSSSDIENWNSKQNAISDLSTIRSGAAAGATAVQPAALQNAVHGLQTDISDETAAREAAESEMQDAISEDRAALIEIVDGGDKNKFLFDEIGKSASTHGTVIDQNGVKYTVNADKTINVLGTATSGAWVYFWDSTTNTAKNFIEFFDGNHVISINRGTIPIVLFYAIDGGSSVQIEDGAILPNSNGTTAVIGVQVNKNSVIDPEQTIYPMICTSAAWKISQAFQPYRPSWQEMWDAIQALQSGGASTQSASTASLMSVKPTIEPDVMPEEGEKQDE